MWEKWMEHLCRCFLRFYGKPHHQHARINVRNTHGWASMAEICISRGYLHKPSQARREDSRWICLLHLTISVYCGKRGTARFPRLTIWRSQLPHFLRTKIHIIPRALIARAQLLQYELRAIGRKHVFFYRKCVCISNESFGKHAITRISKKTHKFSSECYCGEESNTPLLP